MPLLILVVFFSLVLPSHSTVGINGNRADTRTLNEDVITDGRRPVLIKNPSLLAKPRERTNTSDKLTSSAIRSRATHETEEGDDEPGEGG